MKAILRVPKFLTGIFIFGICFAAVFSGCAKFQEGMQKGMEKAEREAAEREGRTLSAEKVHEAVPLVLNAQNFQGNKPLELEKLMWKYSPGDDPGWANPQLDDSAWEILMPAGMNPFLLPKSGWNGIGWFRMRVQIDESVVGQPLSLALNHVGASEIYIDGKPIEKFGRVSALPADEITKNPDFTPVGFTFVQPGEHLIAIRYSNTGSQKHLNHETFAFRSRLAPLNPVIQETLSNTALRKGLTGAIFGICTAIGLLHLLLFALYPRQRENLFYALFLLSGGGSSVIGEILSSYFGLGTHFIMFMVDFVTFGTSFVSFAAYLYLALEKRIPRYLGIIIGLWALTITLLSISFAGISWAVTIFAFFGGILLFLLLLIWQTIVILLIIIRAIKRKAESSLILGLVGFFLVASIVTSVVLSIQQEGASSSVLIGEFLCLVCLVITNAIFLARQFARTNQNLEIQLTKQVELEKEKARFLLIEAENERRAKELDEARKLQLLMLPKSVPSIPNLEIAAYMKPATEVGGDYYDFHLGKDETLTIAVGDATGHGLKAGTVVTAAKALFANLAEEPSVTEIFRKSSIALKKINLRGLYMAMTMLKIKGNQASLSCAGMPSVLVYRDATKQVEEISMPAMPLGSVASFPYREREISLSKGDTVVLMSDGFPEMFNEQNEMLGYDKGELTLRENSHLSAQEIIDRFVETAYQWAGNRPADDDVTFVVMKVK